MLLTAFSTGKWGNEAWCHIWSHDIRVQTHAVASNIVVTPVETECAIHTQSWMGSVILCFFLR
jgi:hypothetical protein